MRTVSSRETCPCMSLHKIIILQATISNECVKVAMHKSQNDMSGEIWESVTWCWSWCQVRFTTVVSPVTVMQSDTHTLWLSQHLTWPHESLSRNWAQPVADVHVLCERVQYIVCMSLTYILISIINSIRVPVFWNVELGGGSSIIIIIITKGIITTV